MPYGDDRRTDAAHRSREILGLALLLVALALCFALFSFRPDDLEGQRNLVGPLGAAVASGILRAIGIIGYLTGVGAVFVAFAVLFGRFRMPSPAAVLAVVSMVIGGTVLAQLSAVEAAVTPYPPGGLLGLVAGSLLRRQAGPAGAALAAVGLLLVGFVITFRFSLRSAAGTTSEWFRRTSDSLWLRYRIGRDARRAARQRERDLLDAAEKERAEKERKTRLQEQARRQAFEERARVAVLQATKRAEERVLAQIETDRTPVRSSLEDDDGPPDTKLPATEPIHIGIPGPGADPVPVIGEDIALSSEPALEDAADVVERIDRGILGDEDIPSTQPLSERPQAEDEELSPEALEVESDMIDEAAGERLVSTAERALVPIDPVSGVETADSSLEEVEEEDLEEEDLEEEEVVDEDLIIHERKAVDTDFSDERAVVRVPEKPSYVLPPINLLDYEGEGPAPVDQDALKARATRLEEKLRTYGVEGKVTAIRPGPVVTTYEYQPAPGVKVAKIANLSDDIAMSMEAVRVRIVAPIPGRGVVGIELPNDKRENVYLKEIIAHEAFKHSKSLLTLALGKDAEGEPQVRDLRKMPHLMIAGTTGSGKSVSINTMVLSMICKATPDQVKFIMVDPKMLELSLYNDIPHLLLPVVTDPKKASLALSWTVDEMERRYRLLSDAKVRDIQGFNKKVERLRKQRAADAERSSRRPDDEATNDEPSLESGIDRNASTPTDEQRLADPWGSDELPTTMPFIVVLIDEFADLMMAAPRDVEASVQRLAQKARAAGIHVLLATQRPSTDVITGVIKNNFPSRLAFRVASRHDSATVLNNPGAENLLGMGDSLFLSVASPNPVRVHGAFVSEDEVERVVEFWKKQAKPVYDPTILQPKEDESEGGFADEDVDELYDQAVRFVTETRKASISALQRKMRVGYNRAARMIEMMEAQGIVGPVQGPKGDREIFVSAMGPDGPERT